MPERDTEIRLVVRSEMTDDELERLTQNVAEDLEGNLVDGEKVICSTCSDKISYESRQAMKELGED